MTKEKTIPATGNRKLKGFVREWGTIMMVTGVKITLRNRPRWRIRTSFRGPAVSRIASPCRFP
jgi:hypothetical protein